MKHFQPVILLLLGASAIGFNAACSRQSTTSNSLPILAYFHPLPTCDTLHVEVSLEGDEIAITDTIPNSLFFKTIPPALLQEIDYLADSSQALVLGRYYFPINDNITAYWVEIRQFWFQHHSLLLYNKAQKSFTDRITLAEWYGGDGGQVLIGSWLFDYDGDGQKDIIRQEIQHSMIPTDDEPLERTEASATLWVWKNRRFEETPIQDTAVIIRRYPIRNNW